jgi:hypothetical protein
MDVDDIRFGLTYSKWQKIVFFVMGSIFIVVALLRYFDEIQIENATFYSVFGEFLGIFLFIIAIHAIQTGYFPVGKARGIWKSKKPVQFWFAVFYIGFFLGSVILFFSSKYLLTELTKAYQFSW